MLRALLPLYRSTLLALDNAACCTCGSFASTSATTSNSSSSASFLSPPAAAGLSTTAAAAAGAAASNSSSSVTRTSGSGSSIIAGGRKQSNAPLAAPWTPTSMLTKRKTYQKRSRFLIQTLESEQQQRLASGKQIPSFRSGDILEVSTVVPEADRKVYTYKGLCIARANKGPRSWFKLYNVFPDAGGFVQHFPLYMPDLLSIKVVGRIPKAHRSKLYYLLRDESPRHSYQADIRVQQQS